MNYEQPSSPVSQQVEQVFVPESEPLRSWDVVSKPAPALDDEEEFPTLGALPKASPPKQKVPMYRNPKTRKAVPVVESDETEQAQES